MSLEALIAAYGYFAIAIGTFFEGETVLVLGGFAAHRGYLELPWVVASGFMGTLCGDQLYCYLGRAQGIKVLEKRPYWRSRLKRVLSLLRSHQSLVVLGFRFLYGLRTVTPFLLGASGISPVSFLILNILGALVWAVAIGVSGYLFGNVFEWVIGDVERHELRLFLALTAVGVIVWCARWLRRQKAGKQPAAPKK